MNPPAGVRAERIVATLGEAADYILTTSESEPAPHE